MVVDDQPLFREVLRNVLEGFFDVVADASSYSDALDLARRHQPHATIVDVNIGTGKDGFQLAKELARLEPEMKIVVTSSYDVDAYRALADRTPRTIFVEKGNLTPGFLLDFLSA